MKRKAAFWLLSLWCLCPLIAQTTKKPTAPATTTQKPATTPKKPPATPAPAPKPDGPPAPSEWHFGMSANLDLVTINLTTRRSQVGFSPGLAFGVKWCPKWWTLSDSFLGIDALVDAKFQDVSVPGTFDYFQINALPVFTVAGLITAGLGVSYNLALTKKAKDTLELIFMFGLSTPVGLTGQ
jgi:hypothetical protein